MRGLAIPNRSYLHLGGNDWLRDLVALEALANKNKVQLCMLGKDRRVFSTYYTVLSTLDELTGTFTLRDSVWGLDEDLKVLRYATIWCLGPPMEPSGTAFNFFVQCQPLTTEWTILGKSALQPFRNESK